MNQSTSPADAGALHVQGLTAYAAGDRARARALLERAAAAPDATAASLLCYAELACKPHHLEAAVAAARRAVALEPTQPLGWLCLGRSLFDLRQFDESRRCFERALGSQPGWVPARSGLASCLGRLGDVPAALALFAELLAAGAQAGPEPEVHHAYALLLRDLGRPFEALEQVERAIRLRPQSIEFHLHAADLELELERHARALARLAALEPAAPGCPPIRDDARFVTLEAHALRRIDRFEEAAERCREAMARGIDSGELQRAHGLALQLCGRETDALAAFERSVAAGCTAALSDRGVLLTQLGQGAAALEAFDQALGRDPTLAEAWYNRSNTAPRGAHRDADAMERLLERPCPARDRLLLHFALGNAHLGAGDVEAAFRHWQSGNRMKRATIDYDADAVSRAMAAIAARPIDGTAPPPGPDPSQLAVFIVGMPRSGSTLVEQILASHPEAHGAGETSGLRALFETAHAAAGQGEPAETWRHVGAAALARLRRHAPQARRIIDKDLANFLHLGVIRRCLPHARIIHCRRDPLDACFSTYTKLFSGSLGFAYDLGELGRYYRDYAALMAHWRAALPAQSFLEIDYEQLVAEPARETRRLLDFLGLEPHPACANFHATARAVRTASVTQVRQPIYRSSIGRAQRWRSQLGPLLEALGDLVPDPRAA